MANTFDIGLKSKLKTFAEKFTIDTNVVNEKDWFEMFSNYIVVSSLINEDLDDPNSISTGKSKGIDGISIIVNNRIIKDESDLEKIGEREKLIVRLCFIQATTLSSFSLQKFQSFTDEVINFLNGINNIEPFSDVLKKLFDEEGRFFEQISETPSIDLFFCSGKTNHQLQNSELETEKRKILSRNDFQFQFNLNDIHILQTDELKAYYEKIDKFLEILLEFNSEITLNEKPDIPVSFVSVLSFAELKKIIVTDEGNGFLREKLFVENVRSKIENSTVNNEILKTLNDDTKRPYFLYMNNGITILCERIKRHELSRNKFYIKHPRIINGCQTSHILYDYYIANPEEADKVEVIAKIISTTNPDLKKDIIYATNNQNAIDKDLETLNVFHTKLEEYFIGRDSFGIYFERLRGQYSEVSPQYKVLTKELIAKSYISILLKEPHIMKSNAISKIEKYREAGKIFTKSDEAELETYYYSGALHFLMNNILSNNVIQLKSKTMDMHILLACDLKLDRDGIKSVSDKLAFLSDFENVKTLFSEVNTILESQNYLFEARGFYSGPKTKRLIDYFKTQHGTIK
ncbi:MAG: AIPR family protein [Bacteroidales bacterium]|nr:AIPR family protein [Bacteroidales bacterium]MDY0388046.1 AIPR family protein [Methanolobus sp.]